MATTNWADLNRDGRRLEGIIKMLNTRIYTKAKDNKDPIGDILALCKLTHEKVAIAETVLGVKDIIKDIKTKPKVIFNEIH